MLQHISVPSFTEHTNVRLHDRERERVCVCLRVFCVGSVCVCVRASASLFDCFLGLRSVCVYMSASLPGVCSSAWAGQYEACKRLEPNFTCASTCIFVVSCCFWLVLTPVSPNGPHAHQDEVRLGLASGWPRCWFGLLPSTTDNCWRSGPWSLWVSPPGAL